MAPGSSPSAIGEDDMTKYKEVIAIALAVISLTITFATFMERMAVIETQLSQIQREILALSDTLSSREERMREFETRIVQLETKVRNLERRVVDAEHTRVGETQEMLAQSGAWTSCAPDRAVSGLWHPALA